MPKVTKKKAISATAKPSVTNEEPAVNKGGRPREWTEGLIEQKRQALEKWISDKENYFFSNFLLQEGLDAKQIERFCNYSERFRQTHARALATQECRIVDKALNRKFDATFAKFVLQNKAGWKEKQEVSGDASNPLAIIMEKIAQNARHPLEDYQDE